jgi:phospholipid/cholesterol/gamma-HCH transport system substrate-binding protein
MESGIKSQIKTGIFAALGLAIALFSIFVIGGDRYFREFATLYVEFEHVTGLARGSVVSLAGFNVGNVENIQFSDASNKLIVAMRIDSNYLPKIREGSAVEVRTQGALGDKFIFIAPGPAAAPGIQAGATLPKAEATDFIGILSEKSDQAKKVFDIIDELHKVSSALNQEDRFAKMVKNLSEASASMKDLAEESRVMVKELRQSSSPKIKDSLARMDRILEKIDKGEGTLGALINDRSLHESIKGMVGSPDKRKNMRSLIRTSIEKSENSDTN